MKKQIFIAALAMVLSLGALAQQGTEQTPEQRAKRRVEMVTKQIATIDKDQQSKLEIIFLEQAKAPRPERGTPQATKARELVNTKIQKVLTPEQYKEYEKILEAQRARMQNGGGHR